MSYHLGVDLGTTYTAAAISRDGSVEMAELGSKTHSIPSVLLIRPDGTTLLGESAQRRARTEPQAVAREFKRRLGDTTPLIVGGSPHSAERLMGRLLAGVVADVSAVEGGPQGEVAVTHPANWGPYRLELLENAIRIADLPSAHLLSEPVAAAINYSSYERVEPGSTIAVYDLGGGTFDAALLRKTDDGFEQLGESQGIERLGGIDFDAALLAHVLGAVDVDLADLAELDDAPVTSAAVARLREDVTLAKETLSVDSSTTVAVMLPTVSHEVLVNRREFEELIRAPVVESVNVLASTIESAGVKVDDVDAMLLVGGSSRIPLVAELVASTLNRPVKVDTHPKNAVALGAARHAASRAAGEPGVQQGAAVATPEPPTGGSVAEAVTAAAGHTSATEPPAAPASLPPPTAPTSPPGSIDPDSGRVGVSPRLLAGGIVAVLVVAVGIVALLMTRGGDDGSADDTDGVNQDDGQPSFVPVEVTEPSVVDQIPIGDVIRDPAVGDGVLWVPMVTTSQVAALDVATGEIVATITVGARPREPLLAEGLVWVSNLGDGTVSVIDPDAMAVLATISVGVEPFLLLGSGGLIWVPNLGDGTMSVIDPATMAVVDTLEIGQGLGRPVEAAGLVWLSRTPEDILLVLDPATRDVVATIPVGDGPLPALAADGLVWVPNHLDGTVSVVDPVSLEVIDVVDVGAGPLRPSGSNGRIAVPNQDDGTVTIVDSTTRSVIATVSVGTDPRAPAFVRDRMWVSNAEDDTVSVIDTQSLTVEATLPVGERPFGAVAANDLVWVPNVDEGSISVAAAP